MGSGGGMFASDRRLWPDGRDGRWAGRWIPDIALVCRSGAFRDPCGAFGDQVWLTARSNRAYGGSRSVRASMPSAGQPAIMMQSGNRWIA